MPLFELVFHAQRTIDLDVRVEAVNEDDAVEKATLIAKDTPLKGWNNGTDGWDDGTMSAPELVEVKDELTILIDALERANPGTASQFREMGEIARKVQYLLLKKEATLK